METNKNSVHANKAPKSKEPRENSPFVLIARNKGLEESLTGSPARQELESPVEIVDDVNAHRKKATVKSGKHVRRPKKIPKRKVDIIGLENSPMILTPAKKPKSAQIVSDFTPQTRKSKFSANSPIGVTDIDESPMGAAAVLPPANLKLELPLEVGGVQSDDRQVLQSLNLNNLGHFEEDEELKYKQLQLLKQSHNRQVHNAKVLREQQDMEQKKKRAQKGMMYLLGKSMQFSTFFKDKLQQHKQTKKRGRPKKAAPKTLAEKMLDHQHKREPKLEDLLTDELFEDDLEDTKKQPTTTTGMAVDITDQLKYFEGGILKPYQVDGLTWLTILNENGVNGILADEMGLGKTVQVIALICHLYEKNVDGPYLIVAPLSTLPNWSSEFKRFAPQIPTMVFHGTKEDRQIQQHKIRNKNYQLEGKPVRPVVITSFQMPLMESFFLRQFHWQYIIIDEGHRIKNHQSLLSRELSQFKSINKLLLTGTPLQNNLMELWALLNFLLPHIFKNMETFASLCVMEDIEQGQAKDEQSTTMIAAIHGVLSSFMLRRLKCDVLMDLVPKKEVQVYCPITKLQRDLYTYVIQKNIAKLTGKVEDEEEIDAYMARPKRKCTFKKKGEYKESTPDDVENLFMEDFLQQEKKTVNMELNKSSAQYLYRIYLQNNMMMFKKIVNHPYLVHFPLDPNSKVKQLLVDEQLVQQSGKMLVLDAMLPRLKAQGHKVLLFSTLVIMMDMIEDYLLMRDYDYRRLDGSYTLGKRQESINEFNTDPNVFLFLISTRAGGLGLNLTAADTVIFFDRDWNPQVDIQAQDRCHRIGQTKPVMVYSLITKNTIDDRIIACGVLKRKLEKIIIRDGKFKSIGNDDGSIINSVMDLKELQKLLDSSDCSDKIHSNGYVFSDKELDNLIDRSDLYEQMIQKEAAAYGSDH